MYCVWWIYLYGALDFECIIVGGDVKFWIIIYDVGKFVLICHVFCVIVFGEYRIGLVVCQGVGICALGLTKYPQTLWLFFTNSWKSLGQMVVLGLGWLCGRAFMLLISMYEVICVRYVQLGGGTFEV